MNLVLGTLDELKAQLLAPELRSDDRFDGAIAALGLGVAARFEQATNRKLGRVVGDTFEFPANRCEVIVPRFPLEAITKIELRETLADGFIDQGAVDDLVENIAEKSGIVYLAAALGLARGRGRLTYTGGYWIDESADGSVDNRSSLQRDLVDLDPDAEEVAIVFPAAFASVPSVVATVITPEGGTVDITATPKAVTAEGFTARLSFPVPGSPAGYQLSWIAAAAAAAAAGGALPDGATALPSDLKLAWLLQCEFVWKIRDKLGINVAPSGGDSTQLVSLTLAGLELLPDVVATLQTYRRFTL